MNICQRINHNFALSPSGKAQDLKMENNQILISRRDLKDKIRKEPFVKIAKEFNVSDKAIVKWCIKYNLPFKKKDINSYSDEEWGLI